MHRQTGRRPAKTINCNANKTQTTSIPTRKPKRDKRNNATIGKTTNRSKDGAGEARLRKSDCNALRAKKRPLNKNEERLFHPVGKEQHETNRKNNAKPPQARKTATALTRNVVAPWLAKMTMALTSEPTKTTKPTLTKSASLFKEKSQQKKLRAVCAAILGHSVKQNFTNTTSAQRNMGNIC